MTTFEELKQRIIALDERETYFEDLEDQLYKFQGLNREYEQQIQDFQYDLEHSEVQSKLKDIAQHVMENYTDIYGLEQQILAIQSDYAALQQQTKSQESALFEHLTDRSENKSVSRVICQQRLHALEKIQFACSKMPDVHVIIRKMPDKLAQNQAQLPDLNLKPRIDEYKPDFYQSECELKLKLKEDTVAALEAKLQRQKKLHELQTQKLDERIIQYEREQREMRQKIDELESSCKNAQRESSERKQQKDILYEYSRQLVRRFLEFLGVVKEKLGAERALQREKEAGTNAFEDKIQAYLYELQQIKLEPELRSLKQSISEQFDALYAQRLSVLSNKLHTNANVLIPEGTGNSFIIEQQISSLFQGLVIQKEAAEQRLKALDEQAQFVQEQTQRLAQQKVDFKEEELQDVKKENAELLQTISAFKGLQQETRKLEQTNIESDKEVVRIKEKVEEQDATISETKQYVVEELEKTKAVADEKTQLIEKLQGEIAQKTLRISQISQQKQGTGRLRNIQYNDQSTKSIVTGMEKSMRLSQQLGQQTNVGELQIHRGQTEMGNVSPLPEQNQQQLLESELYHANQPGNWGGSPAQSRGSWQEAATQGQFGQAKSPLQQACELTQRRARRRVNERVRQQIFGGTIRSMNEGVI